MSWPGQVLIFFLALAIVVSRRPDALLHAQFFAEDGTVWYANAYSFGWFSSLFHSQNGYFQTLPRLAASLALLLPLRYAPLLMNLIGISIQVLPVCILLSWRCAGWAPLSVRGFMAAAYLALPNTMELDASVEEGQWHLALLACMLVLARPPGRKWLWAAFDFSVILLSGLTGPFCILLLPISLVFWWIRGNRFRLVLSATLAITAAIQINAIVQTGAATRPPVGLGATLRLFVDMLAGRIYLGALLGQGALGLHPNFIWLCLVALLGTALLTYTIVKAPWELKLFAVFGFLVFFVSLRNPMVSMTVPQWQVLRDAGGVRYWFFPMLAFAWALIWSTAEGNNGIVRIGSVVALMFMLIGIARDWEYPAYPNNHFPQRAKQFEAAEPGTMVDIPIYPPGWVLRLVKKSSACSALPLGSIDLPSPGSALSGSTTVTGWVVAPGPIQRVNILVDRSLVGSTQPNVFRHDVDERFPQSPNKDKGWTIVLDLSKVTPGKHQLEAQASLANGCRAGFYILPFERVKP